jgi:hypothetical protein
MKAFLLEVFMKKFKMNVKLILMVFILLSVDFESSGQISVDNFIVQDHNYPKPSVNNFIHWMGLSTMEWENEIKGSQLHDRGINEQGCVYYGSGADLKDAVYTIEKCSGNMMSSTWTSWFHKITKLDDLVNELEPFYQKRDENGHAVYAFKSEGFIYYFTISRKEAERNSIIEFVIVTKTNL